MRQSSNQSTSRLHRLKSSLRQQLQTTVSQLSQMTATLRSPSKTITTQQSCQFIDPKEIRNIKSIQNRFKESSRTKELQNQVQTQRNSIKFYLTQLNTKQTVFAQKLQKYQNDCRQQIHFLENLIKSQSSKNHKIQKQIQKYKKPIQKYSCIFNNLANQQLFSLYENVKYQLHIRGLKQNESSQQIKRIKLLTPRQNTNNSFDSDSLLK